MSVFLLRPSRTTEPIDPYIVRDRFDREDSTTLGSAETGQPWTEHTGNVAISGGVLIATAVVSSEALASLDSGVSDGRFRLRTTMGSQQNQHPMLVFRMVDDGNLLMARINGAPTQNAVQLYERVSGTFTLLASAAMVPAQNTWYQLEVVANGSSIAVLVDDVQVIAHTTSRHQSATRVGVRFLMANAAFQADDLEVRALA